MKLADRVHAAIRDGQQPPINDMPDGAWMCWVAEHASCDVSDIGGAIMSMTPAQRKSIGLEEEHIAAAKGVESQ